jgi:hypothetical protein
LFCAFRTQDAARVFGAQGARGFRRMVHTVDVKLHYRRTEFTMTSPCLKRPWIWRVITVTFGVAVFLLGVRYGDFWGLLLMIVGLVPAVIGAADVSLVNEIRDERAHRREQRMVSPLPHERGA